MTSEPIKFDKESSPVAAFDRRPIQRGVYRRREERTGGQTTVQETVGDAAKEGEGVFYGHVEVEGFVVTMCLHHDIGTDQVNILTIKFIINAISLDQGAPGQRSPKFQLL